jgi:hypothetical protein
MWCYSFTVESGPSAPSDLWSAFPIECQSDLKNESSKSLNTTPTSKMRVFGQDSDEEATLQPCSNSARENGIVCNRHIVQYALEDKAVDSSLSSTKRNNNNNDDDVDSQGLAGFRHRHQSLGRGIRVGNSTAAATAYT